MKLLKTIRLDVSDQNIFSLAAEPGEWAVTGTFAFADMNTDKMDNKDQLAFRNGWMGIASFGRSTVVQVATINDDEYENVVRNLAAHLFKVYQAPDMLAALDAAREEVADASIIGDHPVGTFLTIERDLTNEGIVERVNVITSADDELHARIWTIEPDEEAV